jgi:hypothetical protein
MDKRLNEVLDEYSEGDDGGQYGASYSKFIQRTSARSTPPSPTFLAPYGDTSKDEKNKPRSVVDGDYSEYCPWDLKPQETGKQWEPDTIREDIDIMGSIRSASNRR